MKTLLLIGRALLAFVLLLPLIIQVAVTWVVESPLQTEFYSSIPKAVIPERQAQVGVRLAQGAGWAHLGWIASLDEVYRVERYEDNEWEQVAEVKFGSHMVQIPGIYRVVARARRGGSPERVLGGVEVAGMLPAPGAARVPEQAGPWQTLYQPSPVYGGYINDHTLYIDNQKRLHLVGITSLTDGNYNQEKSLAHAFSPLPGFPPGPMEELPKLFIGDNLAWAPHVVTLNGQYHLFYSPHRLMHSVSSDGMSWSEPREVLIPYHKFFRDPMVLILSDRPGKTQAILYTTAKDEWGMSSVDLYQSFDPDLDEWQYIGPALLSGWGSERNAPFASLESPFVFENGGRYYLSTTYNNETLAIYGILLDLHIWPDPKTYNDTLIFSSNNPFDFGVYYGRRNSKSTSFVGTLAAHGPEYFQVNGRWYFTTAGWKWIASLTHGEVAYAPMEFEENGN